MTAPRQEKHSAAVSAWCVVATFGAYFCMYGFRKPFTVAEYDEVLAWGLDYKPLAIISQVLGYTAAKFIGIKVIAELDPKRRVLMLVGLIAAAELALVAFGATPAPWNLFWLFFNGLPLGMVFGLVLGFLEGRRHTEALAAGLCTSFIVADGMTKSVGAELLSANVSGFWMPAAAGLLFAIPLAIFAWMLTRIPPPSHADVAARSERAPMDREQRRRFFRRYGLGLTLLMTMFVLITVLRSVRSDFMPEIWKGLGVTPNAALFTWTEFLVALGVLLLNGSAVLISDNRKAFNFAMAVSIIGPALILASAAGLRAGLSPFAYMVLQGLGLYLPYFAVHTTFFERLIAMTRDRGNIGYLMYLADAFGYLGYVAVLITKSLFSANKADAGAVPSTETFLPFYEQIGVFISIACIVAMVFCWRYFATRAHGHARAPDNGASLPAAMGEWTSAEGRV